MKYAPGRPGVTVALTVALAALFAGLLVSLHAAPVRAADPVLVGAGDIATCGERGDEITANMLDRIAGTVYTLGDNAYESGTLSEYRNCYGPSWGRHKNRTRPVPGNHEYYSGGGGYFKYFGARAGPAGRGYYSYNLGTWHVVSLNSEIAANTTSPQYRWLQNDLAASNKPCTIAMWHRPVFNSGAEHGNDTKMAQIYNLLDRSGADLALVGHEHLYERFAPQTSAGRADPNGLTQITVGTGGRHLYDFGTIKPNSRVRNDNTFGVLKLTLHARSLDFRFVPQPGRTFTDSGTISCGAPPP